MVGRRVFLAVITALLVSWSAPEGQAGAAIRSVVIRPDGALLKVGETLAFRGVALDAEGNEVSGATFTYRSSASSVAQVDSNGLVTASRQGSAIITARTGRRSVTASVCVITPPTQGSPVPVAGCIPLVIHVAADADRVYWTERGNGFVRLRSVGRNGGAITTLASEPWKDSRGLRVLYAQIVPVGDQLYFTRETVGIFDHWSIRKLPKAGGAATEILAEDISALPLTSARWGLSLPYLVVVIQDPLPLRLPDDTRVAVLNLNTGTWRALIRGTFPVAKCFIPAVDDDLIYVRGFSENRTRLVAISPTANTNAFTELETNSGEDPNLDEPGDAADGKVFYWARASAGGNELRSIANSGGTSIPVTSGALGLGLNFDQGSWFFARLNGKISRVDSPGGVETDVLTRADTIAPLLGLCVNGPDMFAVRKARGGLEIVRIRVHTP